MSMFDEITCDAALPDNATSADFRGGVFQTKSLNCFLDHYKITADGRLLILKVARARVLKAQRGSYGAPVSVRRRWM